MTYNHLAVFRAHPNAVVMDDGEGAFDAQGNSVDLDPDLIAAAEIEVNRESAFIRLRDKRNELLAETDRFALADLTMTDAMRTYRQALRDLPANTADPANPVWPVKPGGTN